jgi:hypothetical protein
VCLQALGSKLQSKSGQAQGMQPLQNTLSEGHKYVTVSWGTVTPLARASVASVDDDHVWPMHSNHAPHYRHKGKGLLSEPGRPGQQDTLSPDAGPWMVSTMELDCNLAATISPKLQVRELCEIL